MVDKLDLARRKHARPGLLHIGAQVVEGLPVHHLGIHARDGRKRQHATQALARASFVQIGKIILMRKEAPNLGHDILSIVMTRAAPPERPCHISVCDRLFVLEITREELAGALVFGVAKSSAGAASSSTTPLSIKTTRSDTVRAKAISCVTTTMVMPSAASLRMTSSTSPTISGRVPRSARQTA